MKLGVWSARGAGCGVSGGHEARGVECTRRGVWSVGGGHEARGVECTRQHLHAQLSHTVWGWLCQVVKVWRWVRRS
eukprot:365084-Chlamydomonas_euryale.AAC.6